MVKTKMRQSVPLQPVEIHGGAGIYLQPMEDSTPEQVDAPKRGCDPVGSPCWSKLHEHLWREELMLEQVCWQGL